MCFKKFSSLIILSIIFSALTLFSLTAMATTSQKCKLGETCLIPGNDGGRTIYTVKPEDGLNYICNFKTDGSGPMTVFIYCMGDDLWIINGSGFHTIKDTGTVKLVGRFQNPTDPRTVGQIKIAHLALSETGIVTCNPAV